jgi:hypothetical protein
VIPFMCSGARSAMLFFIILITNKHPAWIIFQRSLS